MKKKAGNVIKIMGVVWDWLIVIALVALLAIKFVPMAFGYNVLYVESNSMAPTFHKGALCFIDTKYDTSQIEKGDILAFKLSNGAMVTHRAHEITEYGIITKGDANDDIDMAVLSPDQVFGENVFQIEHLGVLYQPFPNTLLIALVVFALTMKAFLYILQIALLGKEPKKPKESKKQKRQEEQAY